MATERSKASERNRRTQKQRQGCNAACMLRILRRLYPRAVIELQYANPLELLVATILSAQCTDTRVNIVTRALFQKYRSLSDYVNAEQKEFEQDIYSTGFFRAKAKHIISAARRIAEVFEGRVPDTMEELLTLPGVARKTANIVLYNAFAKQEGIAVDTHVKRLSQRLGLSRHENTDKIERDLMRIVPRRIWGQFTYWIIEHGRRVCLARAPRCGICALRQECVYYRTIKG